MRPSIAVLTAFFFYASAHAGPAERIEYLMGTTARVRIWAPDSLVCQQAIDSVFAAFHHVDLEMSTYRDDSLLSVLNRDGHTTWVDVGHAVTEILCASQSYHRETSGAFDPTVLPLLYLWGFRGGERRLPSPDEIARTLLGVGMGHVEVDVNGSRARFTSPGVSVDLGGIAKGFALDLGKASARRAGAFAGLLDLGGNLLAFGEEARGDVGIQHPGSQNDIVGRVQIRDQSMATSGGYERYVTIDGRRYGHIIDPRTGHPADLIAGVTVVSADGITADALSTACAVVGRYECLQMIGKREDVEGLVVWFEDGEVRVDVSAGLSLLEP